MLQNDSLACANVARAPGTGNVVLIQGLLQNIAGVSTSGTDIALCASGAGAGLTLNSPVTTQSSGAGTIRLDVRYSVNGKTGSVHYDVIYTPELPAVWSGPPREA